jgi:hypothetical protein
LCNSVEAAAHEASLERLADLLVVATEHEQQKDMSGFVDPTWRNSV